MSYIKKTSLTTKVLFVVYLLVAGYLLLLFHKSTVIFLMPGYITYGAYLTQHINLVPLRTVWAYINWFSVNPTVTFAYLAGHLLIFIPMGAFLPRIWERCRPYKYFILVVLAVILAIEAVQLFTASGVFDVDDILLSLLSATIGYALRGWLGQKDNLI